MPLEEGSGQKNKEIWRNFFVKNVFWDILGEDIAPSAPPHFRYNYAMTYPLFAFIGCKCVCLLSCPLLTTFGSI